MAAGFLHELDNQAYAPPPLPLRKPDTSGKLKPGYDRPAIIKVFDILGRESICESKSPVLPWLNHITAMRLTLNPDALA